MAAVLGIQYSRREQSLHSVNTVRRRQIPKNGSSEIYRPKRTKAIRTCPKGLAMPKLRQGLRPEIQLPTPLGFDSRDRRGREAHQRGRKIPLCSAHAKRGKREVPKMMEAEGGPKRQVPRQKKKCTKETPKDEPAVYPEADNRPDPLPPKALLRGQTRVEGNRRNRNKSAESLPEAVIRKPTQPALLCCRRIRFLLHQG